jgi:hypothetical protein
MLILLVGGPGNGKWVMQGHHPLHTMRFPINNPLEVLFVPKNKVETACKVKFPYIEYHLTIVSIGAYKEYIYIHSDLLDKNPLEILLQGYKP